MKKREIMSLIKYFICMIMCLCLVLTGCGNKKDEIIDAQEKTNGNTILVLSKGMTRDELFRIENISCNISEYMVYLTNIQNEYERTYGDGIWDEKSANGTLAEDLKNIALARISRVKTMNLLAEQYGLHENDEIIALATDLSAAYYSTLSQREIEALGIDQATLIQMYTEYIIADALYDKIIQDVNPEISDDEARAVVVEQICVYKGEKNEQGEFVSYSGDKMSEAHEKIEEASQKISGEEAESFESVAAMYNQADEMTISFARGDVDLPIEKIAYSLAENEISDIIETPECYMIIKCISMGAQEQTEENKKKIVDKKRQETFTDEYDDFTKDLTKKMNDKTWNEVELIRDKEVVTDNFFSLYEENEPDAMWIEELDDTTK